MIWTLLGVLHCIFEGGKIVWSEHHQTGLLDKEGHILSNSK